MIVNWIYIASDGKQHQLAQDGVLLLFRRMNTIILKEQSQLSFVLALMLVKFPKLTLNSFPRTLRIHQSHFNVNGQLCNFIFECLCGSASSWGID